MENESTFVLIVGGGLVGLSAAVFLAARGVPFVLVEKHPGSSAHPRAMGYTARTMELYRSVGLESAIPAAPADFRLRRATVDSLAGTWREETPWTPETVGSPKAKGIEPSPCTGAAIAQDRLEPILRARAVELGAEIRLDTELLRFDRTEDSVIAHLRERSGREYSIATEYLVAADGHRSPIREALHIGRDGRGHVRTVRSVLFRAKLDEYLERGVRQFAIRQPDFEAFLTTYGEDRWVLLFSDDEERDDETLEKRVFQSIGRTDIPIELITTGRWELSALIADTFQVGRVFLAGDAAHTLPPNRGGFGANTGIEDAHNLAWKLWSVWTGASKPALLATYDAERRPIAWLRHHQIFARSDYEAEGAGVAKGTEILDDRAMELGQLYRSESILGANEALPPARRPDEWEGQPGTRAPHAWITQKGEKKSLLDLFQKGWVLLTEDDRWRDLASAAAEHLGLEVTCIGLDVDVFGSEPGALGKALGLRSTGASLIRPDGYVAWRSADMPAAPERALQEALQIVSFSTLEADS